MSKKSIFVSLSTFCENDKEPLELLKNSTLPYTIHSTGKRITRDEILRDAKGHSVIIAGVEKYDEDILSQLPDLRCIVRCGVGIDNIDSAASSKRNIAILNTPDIPTQAVAELAFTLYLALSRNIRPQSNRMGQKKWERVEAHLLSGKILGIIGYGRIGRKIAELCKPFNLRILVNDPFLTKETVNDSNVEIVDKATLLAHSDIISIHASGSGTVILDRIDFESIKQGALIVNLSRGGMVKEDALLEALASKKIAGAGLDVFEQEPYSGPFCDFENVILTPHSATLTIETRAAMELQCVEKALHFCSQN